MAFGDNFKKYGQGEDALATLRQSEKNKAKIAKTKYDPKAPSQDIKDCITKMIALSTSERELDGTEASAKIHGLDLASTVLTKRADLQNMSVGDRIKAGLPAWMQ
jgi:hypothetical protein